MNPKYLFLVAAMVMTLASPAAIIGTNAPAQEIAVEGIALLPKGEQAAWKDYLDRSIRQMKADREALQSELAQLNLKEAKLPASGSSTRSLPLTRDDAWYAGTNAQFLADNIVTFQTPAGGWSKNLDYSRGPRQPGDHYAPNNLSRFSNPADFDLPRDTNWDYVGTFDNDATTTQMRFLAKAALHGTPELAKKWRDSFLRGLNYIFAAQFPNGGWPQVWPLQGGYHDCLTYNDGAALHVMELLRDVSQGGNEFAFVPDTDRRRAANSLEQGIQCTLAAQIRVQGRLTVWCQQHNALDLMPAAGRNYEMPAEVSPESAEVMEFLMSLPNPNPAIIASVDGAAAWFKKTVIHDSALRNSGAEGRVLIESPGAPPIWPRFSEIATDRPIFGDRDKTIRDQLSEISVERRRGYSWYSGAPQAALNFYAVWRANIAEQGTVKDGAKK